MIRIFRHYVSKALMFLGMVEAAILILSFNLAHILRFPGGVIQVENGTDQYLKAIVFTVVVCSSLMAMGLYDRHSREAFSGVLLRLVLGFIGAFVILAMLFYAMPFLFMGRGVLVLEFLFSFLGIFISRLIFSRYFSDSNAGKRQIMVLGVGEKAATIDRLLRRKGDRRTFHIVGYVALAQEERVVRSEDIIEYDMPLSDLAKRCKVDELVVAMDDSRVGFPMKEVLDCKMRGIEVIDLLSFFEEQSGKILINQLKPSWLIFSDGFHVGKIKAVIKRMFDLFACLILLSITWPVMIIVTIAIAIEGKFRHPVLYLQQRIGENGRVFNVVKFRSMSVDAEKDGKACWAVDNDCRVTRVGAIIRKLRIDELPQIFNVLKGDMSFVGPRPERPQFVSELADNIPYYKERHRVKPGITGWAQICYPYGASQNDAMEKLQYDLYYVKNFSIFLDLMVIFQTAQVVLWGKGAR